jgi:mannose-6-phosphate isomerase-like protein (cupin superfamily)
MEIHEKIKLIRRQKKLKLADVHRTIKKIFRDNAVTYRTLQRIEAGEPGGKETSLYQVCVGLDITSRELKESTEEKSSLAEHTKRYNRYGRHYFDKNTYAEILTGRHEPFTALFYSVKKGQKTKTEVSSGDIKEKCREWLFVLKGGIIAVVGEKKWRLAKGDCLSFEGHAPHYFENRSGKDASFILVRCPK